MTMKNYKLNNGICYTMYLSKILTRSGYLLLFVIFILFGCQKISDRTIKPSNSSATPTEGISSDFIGNDEFTIAVIPDTQYYMEEDNGGTFQMFKSQIDWIKANRVAENIVYVAGLGDIVDNGDFKAGSFPDSNNVEWDRAKYYYQLETPYAGSPYGIPYGLAVGNHDQTGHEYPLSFSNPAIGFSTSHTTGFYNRYFGVPHFAGRSYYGGSYTAAEPNNNDSHYDLFSAGGINFIVIYLEYDKKVNQYGTQLEDWAFNVLGTYSARKAIIVTHALAVSNGTPGSNFGTPSIFYSRTQSIYDRIKSRKNVFLMLGGHVADHGEGYRQDTYAGNTIKSYVSGYQGRVNGGNGLMRLMKFSVTNDVISVRTYSPHTSTFETDGDSQFTKPLFHEVSTVRTLDFNNSGKSQLSLFRSGVWKIDGRTDVAAYGTATGDIPIPGDYDGDGKAENAYWGSYSPFTWHLPSMPDVNFGVSGAIPVPADYNGNGRTDPAYWLPSTGQWFVKNMPTVTYGVSSSYIPLPADYDGDGKADFAVYSISSGNWASQAFSTYNTGGNGAIPVPGDYNKDGKVDIAYFRPSEKKWYVKGQPTIVLPNYLAGDIPAPGDYDGDGDTDPALYRPSTRQLFANGKTVTISSATSSYKLLNLPYHIRKFFFP